MGRHISATGWRSWLTWRSALLFGIILTVGFVGWVAGRSIVTPSVVPLQEATGEIRVTATQLELGRSIALNVTVTREFRPVAVNFLSGVVTSESKESEAVDEGDILFSVAGTPVRAVTGTLPFYRDLMEGAVGEDVAQLQRSLIQSGYLAEQAVTGTFDTATAEGLKAMQSEVGQSPTGQVSLGELIAVPELPAAVILGDSIVLGGLVSGGEIAAQAQSGEIQFSLVVAREQASLIPLDATVNVSFEGKTWRSAILRSTIDENGSTAFELGGTGGGPVCGDECSVIPPAEVASMRSEVQIVPPTSGPAIPVAAIRTAADGATYVNLGSGQSVRVKVRVSVNGMAVVDGVSVGDEVLVSGSGTDAVIEGETQITSPEPSVEEVSSNAGD